MKELVKNFWTTLKRFRTSSMLNVLGMAVAFASLYIIFVQINHDLFFNRNITDSERIYRVEFPSWGHEGMFTAWVNRPVTENCISNIAAVEACGCGTFVTDPEDCCVIQGGQLSHYKVNLSSVSMPFLKVFSIKPISGRIEDISRPKTVAISASAAKLFGLQVGSSLHLGMPANDENKRQVVAIFNDFPFNVDLHPLQILQDLGDEALHIDSRWGFNYYVKLSPENDIAAVQKQANDNWIKRMKDSGASDDEIKGAIKNIGIRLVPFTDTYYKTDVDGAPGKVGSLATTITLLAVAALIVIIAFINFVNFFFALVPIRIRSINTHKIFGCSLAKMRWMLIFESIGLIIIALLLAFVIDLIAERTSLSEMIGAPLDFSQNIGIAVFTGVLAIVLSIIASIYPAYYITSFPPAMAIKNSFGSSVAGRRLRYFLVGLQFTVSIALIICAFFVHLQHNFMMHYDMGFNKEYVITTTIDGKIPITLNLRNAFDSKLKSNTNINDVAWSSGEFVADSRMGWGRGFKDKNINFQCYPVSWNFLRFMGLTVEEGRDFLPADEFKENGTIIFNMSAKKSFEMTLEDKINGHTGESSNIAGFCKDFNYRPLQYGIEPFAFYVFGKDPWNMPNHLYMRVSANADIKELTQFIRHSVAEIDPDVYVESIDLEFFDEELQRNYESEKNLSMLITLFSLLAIIISLMGVFGLVMFETQHRMKEIAVRRVYGSTIDQILNLFNMKFVKIVIICFVIASPASYFFIKYWLGSYAYKTPIYWWVFALALIIVLIITVVTVTVRSYSAATSDPANMVKSE